ncbi:MAG: DUF5119 domain-containing protein [Rikenellaceae bacterium]
MYRVKSRLILQIAFLVTLCAAACDRNSIPCGNLSPQSAIIPVAIDWSESGLYVEESRSDNDEVHRVSLRFFPLDGSAPFERYMESDLNYDEIEIPVGSYAIVFLNEAITDNYWSGSLQFSDVDSFVDFSAELIDDGSSNSAEALELAAWSISLFEVTSDMATYSRGVMGVGDLSVVVQLTEYESQQMGALLEVVMQPRTRTLTVNVSTTNLGSSQNITASVAGLSSRINIVTGDAEDQPTSHTFELDTFNYATRASSDDSGVASGSRLCFSHSDDTTDGYTLDLEVVMSDGTYYEDEEQLSSVDIADQVTTTDDSDDYTIEHQISLPQIESGSIGLEDWSDGGTVELN